MAGPWEEFKNAPDEQAPWKAFAPDSAPIERSALGEIAAGFKRFTPSAERAAAATVAGGEMRAGVPEGMVTSAAAMEHAKKGLEENAARPGAHNVITNTLAAIPGIIGENIPMMASQAGGSLAGGAAGSAVPLVGNVVGASVGGAAGMGAQQGSQRYYDALMEAREGGLSEEDARAFATKESNSSAALGAGFGAIPLAGGPLRFGAKVLGIGGKKAAQVGAEQIAEKSTLKEFAKQGAVGAAGLEGYGAAQGVATNENRREAGLEHETMGEAALHGVTGGAEGIAAFAPLWLLHAHVGVKTAAKMRTALEDPKAPPAMRAAAVRTVSDAMEKTDPEGANMWRMNAGEALHAKQPIGVDSSWTEGAHPSVFPEHAKPEREPVEHPEDTFEGEGGGRPPSPPTEEPPQRQLPPPGAINLPEQFGPFEASSAAENANDAMHAQRAAYEADQARLRGSGTLGQAAAAARDSGATEAKAEERAAEVPQAETEPLKPAATGIPEQDQADLNIRSWLRRKPGVDLAVAQRAAEQLNATDNPSTVVPHPSGKGYGVVPDQAITPEVKEQHAGLQSRTLEQGEQKFQRPLDIDQAQALATEKTASTGAEHEVIPHPHVREKFLVQPKDSFTFREQPAEENAPAKIDLSKQAFEQRTADREAREQSLTNAFEKDGIVEAEKDGRKIALTNDPEHDGKVRVTSFDGEEPTGHRVYNNVAEAAQEFVGHSVVDRRLDGLASQVAQDGPKQQSKLYVASGVANHLEAPAPATADPGHVASLPSEIHRRIMDSLGNSTDVAAPDAIEAGQIGGVMNSLKKLGMPDSMIDGLQPFYVSAGGSGVMRYHPGMDAIGIRRGYLEAARENPEIAKGMVSDKAHEIAHYTDDDGSGHEFASSNMRARVMEFRRLPDGTHEPLGAVAKEAWEAVKNGPQELRNLLDYPMQYMYSKGRSRTFFQEEVHAQLGALFRVHPELMKEWFPVGYEIHKEIHDAAVGTRNIGDVRKAVRAALWSRDAAGSRAESRTEQRGQYGTAEERAKGQRARDWMGGQVEPAVRHSEAAGEGGRHVVNIGLNTNDGKGITRADVLSALREKGVRVLSHEIKQSATEKTVVARLNRALTDKEAHDVSVKLNQEAIAQMSGKEGKLHGPEAAKWGDFNKKFFLQPTSEISARADKNVTKSERDRLFEGKKHHIADRVDKFAAVFEEHPPTPEYQHAALAGKAARGWYERSRKAGEAMYGKDYPRFAGLMAALSPQTDVESNFYNAAKVWAEWQRKGRPKDAEAISQILKNNIVTEAGAAAGKEAMTAYLYNTIRVLRHETGDRQLSGPKVESFRQNLLGNLDEVTNDRHMAAFAGIMQSLFGGADAKALHDKIGKTFGVKDYGYIAANAKIREAAAALTKATGDKWYPAEVQETVWSFWKALYDLATEKGQTKSALELIRDGSLTHEMIGRVPDLGRYFDEPKFKAITRGEAQGVEGNPAEAARLSAAGRAAPREKGPIATSAPIERIAKRLDALIADRQEAERLNREKAADVGDAQEEAPLNERPEPKIRFVDHEGRGVDERRIMEPMTDSKTEARFTKSGDVIEPAPIRDVPKWMHDAPADYQGFAERAGVFVRTKSWRERWNEIKSDLGLKIIQGAVDQYAPILKHIGQYSYDLLRMASSASNGLATMLEHGHVFMNKWGALDLKEGTKSIKEIFQPLGGEGDRALAWIAANRANELKGQDRENNFTEAQIQAGLKSNENLHANDHFKGKGTRKAAYDQFAKDFAAMNKSVLDIGERAGIIDPEARKLFESEFYINFRREKNGEPEFEPNNIAGMVNAQGIKRLQGGKEMLHDLLANTITNWQMILDSSMKNNAAWHSLEMLETKGMATKVKAGTEGSVFVLEHGKQVHWVIQDKLVAQALGSLNAVPFRGPVMHALTKFKHYLTVGVTSAPTFRVNNVIRDIVAATASNPISYDLISNVVNGIKYSSKNNPEFGHMLAGGAYIEFGQQLGDNRAAYAKRLIDEHINGTSILDSERKVATALKKGWDWWQETGNRSERITRTELYRQNFKRLVDEGHDAEYAHFKASVIAKDSMDFTLHGTSATIRMLTQVVPFMNARLQGLYKLQRGYSTDHARFGMVMGAVTLGTIGLALAYRDDKEMQARSEWDRDNFWAARIGDTMVRMPKPFEIGAVASIVERGLEAAMNGFGPGDRERFASRLWAIVGSQLNMNPIPQAVSPVLQLWANKNSFTGNQIETQREQNLPTAERIGPTTSPTAQLLGKGVDKTVGALMRLTGLGEGAMSPQQIDFAVNAYLGWAGNHAMMAADLAVRPVMDLPGKPTPRIDDYFVIGDFIKKLPPDQSRFTEMYYNHLKKTQEAVADVRMLQQTGQLEKMAQVMKENKNETALAHLYQSSSRRVGQINQRMRWVSMRGDDNMSPDEKRAELDRLTQLKNNIIERTEATRTRSEARQ